jgi:AmmeMemoRadiSam system protein B
MDTRVRNAVADLDGGALQACFAKGEAEACGRRGLLTLLSLFGPEKHAARITAFTNSGEVVGDHSSRIVGYMSAVITENGGDP